MNLLFLPHFPEAPKSERPLLPKRTAAFWEGTQRLKGGTGKAEAVKLPGAGIGPKQCPGKEWQKRWLPKFSSIGFEGPWAAARKGGHQSEGSRGVRPNVTSGRVTEEHVEQRVLNGGRSFLVEKHVPSKGGVAADK